MSKVSLLGLLALVLSVPKRIEAIFADNDGDPEAIDSAAALAGNLGADAAKILAAAPVSETLFYENGGRFYRRVDILGLHHAVVLVDLADGTAFLVEHEVFYTYQPLADGRWRSLYTRVLADAVPSKLLEAMR